MTDYSLNTPAIAYCSLFPYPWRLACYATSVLGLGGENLLTEYASSVSYMCPSAVGVMTRVQLH